MTGKMGYTMKYTKYNESQKGKNDNTCKYENSENVKTEKLWMWKIINVKKYDN